MMLQSNKLSDTSVAELKKHLGEIATAAMQPRNDPSWSDGARRHQSQK